MKDVLVILFKNRSKNIKTRVYRETLKHITGRLSDVRTYRFVNNRNLLKLVEKNNFTSVISTNEISSDTALLVKGAGLVQILIGMEKSLLEISDIIIDPLIQKSERYLVGTRYLLSSILDKVPARSLAGVLGLTERSLRDEVNHNEAETELVDIATLYQKLAWDSDFFGVNIGFLSCLRLTPNIEKHVKKFIRKEKIDLLEYLCNCHDRESVITSEKNGYSFVDIRLTFERFLNGKKRTAKREDYCVLKGTKRDIKSIRKIAQSAYRYSRYYFDPNFDRKKMVEFYANWAEKAIRGTFDDFAYVLYRGRKPVGFCAVKKMRKKAAKIGLFGIDNSYKGKGLGKYLLDISLERLEREEGVNYVEVVTQGRNYAAQRLYERCGFVTKTTELWYHKWFH